MKEMITQSIQGVEEWVEDHDYKGYDPGDGLSSFLRPLTFHNVFAERMLLQLVLRSPVNLRPVLGIRPQESTKGRGYMAWGYLRMLRTTGNQRYTDKAVKCLQWLIQNKAPGYSNHSWGNHFDFCTRCGRLPRSEPTIVWSGLIGQAFLDAYEALGDKRYLEVATSICAWILGLPRAQADSGACLSYVAYAQNSVHNSNMLGAAMLARTARFAGDAEALRVAREAMEYSCSRQHSDGSWYYGESPNLHWIDCFHTGYNLDSLKCYIDSTEDRSFEENLSRGFKYFKETFVEESGRPKYYHDRVYPVDIQCASQAIDTLANFSEYDGSSLELSLRVAEWTIENMQDETGYFYYRVLPWTKVRTPMFHWGQATMYKALAHLLTKTCG